MDLGEITVLFDRVLVPELAHYLGAILGLLLVWQYHQNLVLKGRILAVDFWDFTGVRMLLHVTAEQGRSCAACREAHGTLFLPSLMTNKRFSPLTRPCTSPLGCRCLTLGLYGGWPEADRFLLALRQRSRERLLRLTHQDLLELVDGSRARDIPSDGDRLTMQFLQGLYLEDKNPDWAMGRYRTVIDEAKGARDLRLLVPAYFRLIEVVEQTHGPEAALEVIYHFEKRFARLRRVFYYPSPSQREAISDKKFKLKANVTQAGRLRL